MRTLLALMVALGMAGCMPVKDWMEADRAPKAGDLVRIETREGKRHVFRVYRTDETAFYGVATNNKKYRVPYGALKSIEVRGTDFVWVRLTNCCLFP